MIRKNNLHQLVIGGTGLNKVGNKFKILCASAGIIEDAHYYKGQYKGDQGSFIDELNILKEELQVIEPKVIYIDLDEMDGRVREIILLAVREKDKNKIEEIINLKGSMFTWSKFTHI